MQITREDSSHLHQALVDRDSQEPANTSKLLRCGIEVKTFQQVAIGPKVFTEQTHGLEI